mgnify:CR=1 FL=1
MRKSLLIHHDLYPVFEMLTDEEAGKIIKAVFAYDINGEITGFDDRMLLATYRRITECIDRNIEKYEETVERNRKAALIRWEKKEKSIS